MNKIVLAGAVLEKPIFSHSCEDKKFYRTVIATIRKSEAVDIIPCILSEQLVEEFNTERIQISGEIHTRNYQDEKGAHLDVFVFVDGTYEYEQDENYIEIGGTICKKPIYRHTPLGREICDVIVATNRENGKSDYVPCIFWADNAKKVNEMTVGTKLSAVGRLQSREYKKGEETRVAYELSVSRLECEK